MRKLIKLVITAFFAVTVVISAVACSPADAPHTHKWGEWQRSSAEHWRICTEKGCKVEQHDWHDGGHCSICKPLKVLAFYSVTTSGDMAHYSFAREANAWFTEDGKTNNYEYEFSNDWGLLNSAKLADTDVVMFLDGAPGGKAQREAFETYMRSGGGFIGFHVSAFTQRFTDWEWYHHDLLGSDNYSWPNTWKPTIAKLQIETHGHPATKDLPETFIANPCEWYDWSGDLRGNPDITVLASVHADSFPLGDGSGGGGANEIWTNGDHPIVWTNSNYNMVYYNWGHNDNNYDKNNVVDRSKTFSKMPGYQIPANSKNGLEYTDNSDIQNKFVIDGMFGVAGKKLG